MWLRFNSQNISSTLLNTDNITHIEFREKDKKISIHYRNSDKIREFTYEESEDSQHAFDQVWECLKDL